MGLWYPRKYFNMNLFQHELTFDYNHCTCIVDIAHEYLLPLFKYVMYYTVILFKLSCTVGHLSILWITREVT